jgi:hypothetical protein
MNEVEKDKETQVISQEETSPDTAAADETFQVTVRKLEMPVRPRGVLAE